MTEDTWSSVDNQRLDSRSYDDVREQVRTLAGYWPGLASVLGLSPSVIREIEATHRLPAKCLDDAIGRWLRENYKVERFGLPSWMALVKAVEDRNGGRNPALAKKIAQEHPHMNHPSRNMQPVYRDVGSPTESIPLGHAVQESRALHRPEYTHLQLSSPTEEGDYQRHSSGMEESVYQNISSPTEESVHQRHFPATKETMYEPLSALDERSIYQQPTRQKSIDGHTPQQPVGSQQIAEHINPSLSSSRAVETSKLQMLTEIFRSVAQEQHTVWGGKTIRYRCFDSRVGWSSGMSVDLSTRPVKPIMQKRDDHFDYYQMDCHPHGIAVIINNQNFTKLEGINTTVDELNLIQTFRNLGYKIQVYNDLSANEIMSAFDDVQNQDHGGYDSFVCCLLTCSDGQGNIYGCDCEKLGLDSLISRSLGGHKRRSLYGKPKMIFVSTRCILMNGGLAARTEEDGSAVVPLVLPSQADFFYGSSSASSGSTDGSSFYITSLCEALCEHGLYADLTSIHEIVQCAVAVHCQGSGLKQITENSNRLTKKVYFAN